LIFLLSLLGPQLIVGLRSASPGFVEGDAIKKTNA
jgi:hypothetical protein